VRDGQGFLGSQGGCARCRWGWRGTGTMTKSELIERIAQKQSQLAYRDVELAVKTVLEHMADRLASGERIEIRGFGSFSLHFRPGRVGRNPKTGAPVSLPAKHVPHFKPGKELRERVDGRGPAGSRGKPAATVDKSEEND
jgi:integration host factor subunit beta